MLDCRLDPKLICMFVYKIKVYNFLSTFFDHIGTSQTRRVTSQTFTFVVKNSFLIFREIKISLLKIFIIDMMMFIMERDARRLSEIQRSLLSTEENFWLRLNFYNVLGISTPHISWTTARTAPPAARVIRHNIFQFCLPRRQQIFSFMC